MAILRITILILIGIVGMARVNTLLFQAPALFVLGGAAVLFFAPIFILRLPFLQKRSVVFNSTLWLMLPPASSTMPLNFLWEMYLIHLDTLRSPILESRRKSEGKPRVMTHSSPAKLLHALGQDLFVYLFLLVQRNYRLKQKQRDLLDKLFLPQLEEKYIPDPPMMPR
jgi:hypothetical protein